MTVRMLVVTPDQETAERLRKFNGVGPRDREITFRSWRNLYGLRASLVVVLAWDEEYLRLHRNWEEIWHECLSSASTRVERDGRMLIL